MKRFADKKVAAVFRAYPPKVRAKLMDLRELVFGVAEATDGVGPLDETLKWGQPSYLTGATGSGSTIRLDRLKKDAGYALYFHCQSGLVDQFRDLYGDVFRYEGKRALLFDPAERLPVKALRHCIGLALTHHLRKKSKGRS